MGRPYSFDLRLRVVGAVCSGMSYKAVAKRYEVSESSVIRWARRMRETGTPAALPMGGKRPFALAEEQDWLLARVAAKPDVTLRALLADLEERGIEVSYYALWNILDRAGLSFKKKPARRRTGPRGRGAPAPAVAEISRPG